MPYGTLDTYGQMHGPKISAAGILGAPPAPCVPPKCDLLFLSSEGPWLLDHHGRFPAAGPGVAALKPTDRAEQSRDGQCDQVTVPRSERHTGTLPPSCDIRVDFGKGWPGCTLLDGSRMEAAWAVESKPANLNFLLF